MHGLTGSPNVWYAVTASGKTPPATLKRPWWKCLISTEGVAVMLDIPGLKNAPRDERTMHHICSQEGNDKLTVNESVNSHTSDAACVPGNRRHARRRRGKSILYSQYNSYKEHARSRDRSGPCLLIHCISRHNGHHLSKTYSNFGFIDERPTKASIRRPHSVDRQQLDLCRCDALETAHNACMGNAPKIRVELAGIGPDFFEP